MSAHLAVYRLFYEFMHNGGDGGVQDKRYQEEEPKHTDNAHGAQEHGGVVLDII